MSFIADGVAIALKGIGIALFLFVIFLIIVAVVNWYVSSQEMLHRNAEVVAENIPVIVENVIKSCSAVDNALSSLNETLAENLQNEIARNLAKKLLDQERLSECEWQEFVSHLNEWEKRRLNVYDLACDISSCVK
ncbi:hypothetical protein [Candidatus Nitrosopumilus sediminis]|uniref:Uncharacterized protein n=1 Tax=Candidatus Nitrosopumilus sediminis TaxID=1229909 RepID=K0BDI1_9ARCH|nr:hypothetical protein [Candidatus Nitrosopumilus sediminis]AFS83137.1 hypothetical protein NSED_06695 [Candidatus Nitrosopumilus sediminis]